MGQHWAHPLLVGMDTACDVLICTQADAMPRAYLLNPRFQPFYADTMIHPHPRADQTILYEGKALPRLMCFLECGTDIHRRNELLYPVS